MSDKIEAHLKSAEWKALTPKQKWAVAHMIALAAKAVEDGKLGFKCQNCIRLVQERDAACIERDYAKGELAKLRKGEKWP